MESSLEPLKKGSKCDGINFYTQIRKVFRRGLKNLAIGFASTGILFGAACQGEKTLEYEKPNEIFHQYESLGTGPGIKRYIGTFQKSENYFDETNDPTNFSSIIEPKENSLEKISLEFSEASSQGIREDLEKIFGTVYRIKNSGIYVTSEGNEKEVGGSTGSGILFEGGYFLTAAHTLDGSSFERNREFPEGEGIYIGNRFFIEGEHELTGIIMNKELDYALLKLKDKESADNLSRYEEGMNIPENPGIGMTSVVMGYSVGVKNLRIGNLSNLDGSRCRSFSGQDTHYMFANNVLFGDSGGPIFVLEDEELKLAAIVSSVILFPDSNFSLVRHPTNIGCGVRADVIRDDIKENLIDSERYSSRNLERILGISYPDSTED